jgi:hypothetical protein
MQEEGLPSFIAILAATAIIVGVIIGGTILTAVLIIGTK